MLKKVKVDLSTEYGHQRVVILWSEQASIRRRWPELKKLFHIKNETTEGVEQVAIDKASGVKKGVPDLCLPVARHGYHSLYIEMKKPGGRPSNDQKWWIAELLAEGNFATVCEGYTEAIEVLQWYLGEDNDKR